MEILTTKRENFRVKLHSIDNDFNEWLEVKKLSKEFKINISSEGQKDVKNVYKQMEEIWKIISKEKEMLSKTRYKNYKRDLIQYLNHQAQHNQHKIKIRDRLATIIQTKMKVMISLTTSKSKNFKRCHCRPYQAKHYQLIIVNIIKIEIAATRQKSKVYSYDKI